MRGRERGGAEKGRNKLQETVAEPQLIWGMLCADDAGIVSRSRDSLAKMLADIVTVRGSLRLTVSEPKTESTCLMTKHMNRVTFVSQAAGQVCKQTIVPSLCTLGQQCARTPTLLLKSTGACCWPTYVPSGIVCHCTTSPRHRSGSNYGCSKPRYWRPC